MKALLALTVSALRLHIRTRPAMFTTVLMPFVTYFIYMSIFAGGQPARVLGFLAPVMVLMATTNGIYGVGGDLLMMRDSGTLVAYNLAPVSSTQILISRIVLDLCMTLIVGSSQLFLSIWLFHITIHAHIIDLIIIAVISAATLGALGSIVVSISNSFFEANIYSQIIFLTIFILSGLTLPVRLLPPVAQHISHLLPTTMLVTSLTGVLVSGERVSKYWPEMVTLVGFIATGLALASALFRWDREQMASRRDKVLAAISLLPMIIGTIVVHMLSRR